METQLASVQMSLGIMSELEAILGSSSNSSLSVVDRVKSLQAALATVQEVLKTAEGLVVTANDVVAVDTTELNGAIIFVAGRTPSCMVLFKRPSRH